MSKTPLEHFQDIKELEVDWPRKTVEEVLPYKNEQVEKALTKFDKIKTIMDTWNTSGIMSDKEALRQIDEVLNND